MYKLIADGKIIGQSGDNMIPMSGQMAHEINSCPQWEATLSANNPFKDYASGRYSDIVLKYKDRNVFSGQCMGRRINSDTSVTYTLCGDLSFLKESVFPPIDLVSTRERFEEIIRIHNEQVSDSKRIALGDVWESESLRHWSNVHKTTWDFVSEHVQMFGGVVNMGRDEDGTRRLSWTENGGHFCSQPILQGDNLLTIERENNEQDIFTCILAKSSNGLTVELTDEEAIAQYGKIWAYREYDVETVEELTELARAELDSFKRPTVSVMATAIDKSFFGNAEPFSVGDFVRVTSRAHGIDGWFPVSSIKHDISGTKPPDIVCGGLPKTITSDEERNRRFAKWVRTVSNVEPEYILKYAVDVNRQYAEHNGLRAMEGVLK